MVIIVAIVTILLFSCKKEVKKDVNEFTLTIYNQDQPLVYMQGYIVYTDGNGVVITKNISQSDSNLVNIPNLDWNKTTKIDVVAKRKLVTDNGTLTMTTAGIYKVKKATTLVHTYVGSNFLKIFN